MPHYWHLSYLLLFFLYMMVIVMDPSVTLTCKVGPGLQDLQK